MATVAKPTPGITIRVEPSFFDEDGFPWLENGERMDARMFLERYEKMPPGWRAELIGGIVYVIPSPLQIGHARSSPLFSALICFYTAHTLGTEVQDNATTVIDDERVPQPDSALLILPEYGGQSIDGEDEYTHGVPELVVEVAISSRSTDLNAKLADYERGGALEYIVYDVRKRKIHWFERRDDRLVPMAADADGLFRSRAFPGFWIDPAALAANDKPALFAALGRGLATPEHAAFVAELERRRAEGLRPPG
ncbi:MAG TPA: Uma2 family endonuclease [Isosphaeraceae bacterium]|jgi:Uma2 family endonuclease|nr:Uma2 family endonuclease [Isosphaeraceae bacterium]